jgi:hypothetical protein
LDLPTHVAELVRACWELGGRARLGGLRLRKWAHMLGFGGHFSTTLGALRRARVAYAIRRRRGNTLPLDAWGRPEDDQAVIVVASWRYLGSGYQTTGEAWLAASAAARARVFERRIAYRKLGRYVRFHPDDLAEYVAATRVAAGTVPGAGGTVARIRPRSTAARRRAG